MCAQEQNRVLTKTYKTMAKLFNLEHFIINIAPHFFAMGVHCNYSSFNMDAWILYCHHNIILDAIHDNVQLLSYYSPQGNVATKHRFTKAGH